MNNIDKIILKENIEKAILNNGLSFEGINEHNYKYGYVVGVGKILVLDTNHIPNNKLIDIIVSIMEQKINDQILFVNWGIWIKNDKLYIDYVKHIDHINAAYKVAIKLNEKAIWDCEEQKELEL